MPVTAKDILKRAESSARRGPRSWYEGLSPKMQSVVCDVRKAIVAGETSASVRAIAKEIIAICKENGEKPCSLDHLRVWLTRD